MNLGLEKHRQQQIRTWLWSEQATVERLEFIDAATNNKCIMPVWRKHKPTAIVGNDIGNRYYQALLDILDQDGYRTKRLTRPGRSKDEIKCGRATVGIEELTGAFPLLNNPEFRKTPNFPGLNDWVEDKYVEARTERAREEARAELRQKIKL